jgi:hypothetical protein
MYYAKYPLHLCELDHTGQTDFRADWAARTSDGLALMSQSTSTKKSVLAQHNVNAAPTHTGVVMQRSQTACGLVIALGLYVSVHRCGT